MCLQILVRVEPSARGPIGPPGLRAATGLSVRKIKSDGRTAFHISTDGTCSCGLLAAGNAPDGEHWTFADDSLDPLAKIVEALAAKGRIFDFLAHWPGTERPRRTENASAASLARTIRMNTVQNNVLYQVLKA
jgi:hypothetical protein